MKLSLNGFHKIGSTDKTTTLQHPSGHQMTINHTILSPKMRGEIAALPTQQKDISGNKHPDKSPTPQLADGGEVPYDSDLVKSLTTTGQAATYRNEPPPSIPKQKPSPSAATNVNSDKAGEAEKSFVKEAKGGEIKEYAEGGGADNGPEAADKRITEQNTAREEKEKADKSADEDRSKAAISQEQESAPQGPGGPSTDSIKSLIDSHKNLTDAHNAIVQSLAGSGQSQPQASGTNITANATPGADQTTAGPGPQVPNSPIPQTPEDKSAAGLSDQSSSAAAPPVPPAPVTAAAPPQTGIPGYDQNLQKAQQSMADYQNYAQDQQAKDTALYNAAMANKIDPNRLVNSQTTVQKIGNIIGLVLGGLGAGATGGKNLALSAMNDAIEKDIDAQKANQGNEMNAYKMNLEGTKNELAAKALTANQFLTLAQAQLTKQAAGSANVAAQQQAALMVQQIQQKKDENTMNAYKMKILNNFQSGSGGSSVPAGQLDKNKLSQYEMAGVIPKDDAKVASKEAENYQEGQKLRSDMEESAQHLDSKFLAGALTPGDRKSAINAFAGRIAKIAEGRFNLEESKLQAEALLPSPGNLPSTVKNKAKRRAEFFDSLTPTTTLEQYGILTPKSPGGAETKTINGSQYQKVPGGWKKIQ